jgi:peptidoglycan/LPS O-acetylase OafA/YrhL
MKFRYDINALRCIAVLGVIFFHYNILFFNGGFSGVDIFFVISGYLMSKIIIGGINKNDFSIVDFYNKRLKRIVPALLFLVFIITFIGFFFYFPNWYEINEGNAAASLTFISNIVYWKKTNYFDPSSDTNMFLHTWSLSVEWQFYLLYPLVLLFLNKVIKKTKVYLIVFTASTLFLLLFSILFTHHTATASFYLFPSRAWEMFAGGLAYLFESRVKIDKSRKYIAIAGYIMLLLSLVMLNSQMPWPGTYTILPVFGTLLVIIANCNDFRVLKLEVVQFLGRISYSLYLWHWPLYVLMQYFGIKMDALSIILLILASVGIAAFSFKYIESIKFKSSKKLLIIAALLIVCTTIFSFVSVNHIIFSPVTVNLDAYTKMHKKENTQQFNLGTCFMNSDNAGIKDFKKEDCLYIDSNKKNILLIGDSHAAQFSESLRDVFKTRNINLLQSTASGCFPLVNKNGLSRCSDIIGFIYDSFIVNHADKIDGVIISAHWIDEENMHATLIYDIKNTIAYLQKYKLPVIIIGQNKTYIIPYPSIAAKEYQYKVKISANYVDQRSYKINDLLSKNLNPYYINIYASMDSFPKVSANHVPYMFDMNHFTKYGTDEVVRKLLVNPLFVGFLQQSDAKFKSAASKR